MANEMFTVPSPYGTTVQPTPGAAAPTAEQINAAFAGLQAQIPEPTAFVPSGTVAYSPSRKQFFVNGMVFGADDETKAVQSLDYLNTNKTSPLPDGDWQTLDTNSYLNFVNKITDPTMARLAKRNFGIGVDNLQLLGGAALRFAGAEDTGKAIMDQQKVDLSKTLPYQREFTDIGSAPNRGVIDWFVANLAQQGPNLIESAVTAAAGFLAGSAAGGGVNPFTGTAAAMAGLVGKAEVKAAMLAAARKYAAGEALTQVETQALKQGAGILGATLFSIGQNYGTGVADIYNEQLDSGKGTNRLLTLASAAPYAALESLPEFALASRLFGGTVARAATSSTGRTGRDLLKRLGTGAVVGGSLEGLTEAGQESILMANSGSDFTSKEGINRLINSFAAGFGVGGPIGALTNLKDSKTPTNILNKDAPAEQPASAPTPEPGMLFSNEEMGPAFNPLQDQGQQFQQQQISQRNSLLQQRQQIMMAGQQAEAELNAMANGNAALDQSRIPALQGQIANARAALQQVDQQLAQFQNLPGQAMPAAQAQQGQMALFQGAPGMVQQAQQTQAIGQQAQDIVQQRTVPAQMSILDFLNQQQNQQPAQAAAMTNLAQQTGSAMNPAAGAGLNALQQQIARQRAFQLAEQQQAAERERQMNLMEAQRQQQIMMQSQQQPAPAPMPMVQMQPRSPQQLSLFSRREAPVPSRAEGMRRGVGTQLPIPTGPAVTPRIDLRRGTQVPLITQQGQPSVAALKSAGTRQAVPVPTLEAGATQIAPTGNIVTPQSKAAALKKATKGANNATQKGKQQQGNQQQHQNAGGRLQENGGNRNVAPQKQEGGNKASGSDKLKQSGKKQEVKKEEPPKPPTPPKGGKPLKKSAPTQTKAEGKAAPKAETLKKGPSAMASIVTQLSQPAVTEGVTKEAKVQTTSDETEQLNRAIREAVETVNTTRDPAEYADAVYDIVDTIAYETRERSLALKMSMEAVESGDIPRSDFVNALRQVAFDKGSAIQKGSKLYKLLEQNKLLEEDAIKALVAQPKGIKTTAPAVSSANISGVLTPEQRLSNLIDNRHGLQNRDQLRRNALILWADVNDGNFSVGERGVLSDFFDEDGEPKIVQVPGKSLFVLSNTAEEKMTKDEFLNKHNEARKALRELESEESQTTLDDIEYDPLLDGRISDRGDLEYYRADNKPVRPMSLGNLKMLVVRAVSKYARKPNVHVFQNLADMKARSPELFRSAAQARKEGDIEAVNAAGMAWGNTVVLFADNIGSEQHARFILAHETLGHVGFRGLFGSRALDAVLQRLLDTDAAFRNATEVYANGKGISQLEAAEEVLSDRAAALDTNTILRFWNWAKNQLNKLGFRFRDDAARYIIGLSRQYVRQGVGRSELNISKMHGEINRMLALENSDIEVLRFAQSAPQGAMTQQMGMLNRNNAVMGGLERSWREIMEAGDRLATGKGEAKGYMRNLGNVTQTVLDGLQTQDNVARKTRGGELIFKLLQRKNARQAEYKTQYANGTATAHEAKFWGYGEGPNSEELTKSGELMAYATLLRMNQLSDTQLNAMDDIAYIDPDLGFGINDDAIQTLLKAGEVTAEEFKKGFKVQQGTIEVPMTDEKRTSLGAERDKDIADLERYRDRDLSRIDKKIAEAEKLGDEDRKLELMVSRRRAEKSYTSKIAETKSLYAERIAAPTYEAPNMVDTPAWFKNLDENGIEFKMFKEFITTLAQSHVDVLRSKYAGAIAEQKRAISSGIDKSFKTALTEREQAFITSIADQYDEMRLKDAKIDGTRITPNKQSENEANEFLNFKFGRAFGNDLALGDLTELVKGYTPEQVKEIVTGLRSKLRRNSMGANISQNSIWELKRNIEERAMFASSLRDDQLYAKRSIAGSYVPLKRDGEWQVRVQAYAADGSAIKLRQGQQDSLAFFMTGTEKDAVELQKEMNAILQGEYDMRDESGASVVVKLRAVSSVVQQSSALVDTLHYDEVMYSLQKLGIRLDPGQQEVLIKKLTSQNSRARSNIQRAAVPGWDANVVRSASAFLEQQAYTAANKEFRHQFDNVMENPKNWMGDPERLNELKTKWETATGAAKEIAAREYFQEKYYYDNVVSETEAGRRETGNYYRDMMQSHLDWLNQSGDLNQANDWTGKDFTLAARTWTALAQLGGSIATGISQVISLPTNSWAYLAGFNPETGFGVGLGAGKAGKLLSQFAMMTANPKYADLKYLQAQLDQLQKSGDSYTADGLTGAEVRFLFDLTEQQRLDAAQFNALTGTVRGKKGMLGNNNFQKFAKVWMLPFSYSEQFNRRVTLLAAYRGEYERQVAAGVAPSEADASARRVAEAALDATQGDYAMYNRPAMFRSGLMSFVYMYKQYPVMMIQLLKNMNAEGRIIMLGSLIALAGFRGLPGADDLMDIIDGLCQRLGLKVGSVEKEFMRLNKSLLGEQMGAEVTQLMSRGVLDYMTGWSFSNRTGLGDIIPGTSLLKPSVGKAEIIREIENLAGAPTSFLVGTMNLVGTTIPAVVTGRQSPMELLRDSPVRAIKNMGDAWRYASTGALLDSKGYVVAKDATAWEILGKAIGFYPARAQAKNDWLAADSSEQEYASMIRTEAVREAVAARLENDKDRERNVKAYIREWNASTKGTRLEMANFDKAVERAYKEAKMPLQERALKSSSKMGREEARSLLRMYGADEDALEKAAD